LKNLISRFLIFKQLFSIPFYSSIFAKDSGGQDDEIEMNQPMEELMGDNRVILASCQEELGNQDYDILGTPFAMWLQIALHGGLIVEEEYADKNMDGYISVEEAFEFARPRAVLELAMLTGIRVLINSVIDWIHGEGSLAKVLFWCTVYGITLQIPQMLDGNPGEDIILTDIS
jgi:hypothetical protein